MFTEKELRKIRGIAGLVGFILCFVLWILAEMIGGGILSWYIHILLILAVIAGEIFCLYIVERSEDFLLKRYNVDVLTEDEYGIKI